MSKDKKENRINSLALTFLERQQIRPNIFADQIIRGYKEGYHQAEKDLELAWNNVNDGLPKEEFDDGYTFVFVVIKLDEETYRFDVDYIRNEKWELHPDKIITHWMPIPSLPNTED